MSRPCRESSSRKGQGFAFALGLCAVLASPPAAAAEPAREGIELRHDLRIDIPATAVMATGLVLYTGLLREKVVTATCRWCDGPRPDGINDFDRFFRDALAREDPQPAATMSHVVSYGFGPAALGVLAALTAEHEGQGKNIPLDLLLVAEATLTALTVTDVIKGFSARERPGVHQIVDDQAHDAETRRAGAVLSFPSGHTLAVFAATSAAGTIATMRGYRLAPLIWIVGSMLGVTAGYLRMAANQHYITDTLAGGGLGVLLGAGVPWLFHRPTGKPRWIDRATLTTQPVPQGRVLSLTIAF